MGERRRRNSEQGARGRASSRRNSRTGRRKSGPKSYDVECVRAGGKQNRRRLSDGLRRRSKNSRASVRRLSLERLQPPAFPNPVAKVGGATTPRASARHTGRHRGFGWGTEGGLGAVEEVMGVDEREREQPPPSPGGPDEEEVEEEEEEEDESSHWTPEMVDEAARGVVGGDRTSQLRSGCSGGVCSMIVVIVLCRCHALRIMTELILTFISCEDTAITDRSSVWLPSVLASILSLF